MLTLQFIPYADIENLPLEEKIKKILGIVKDERIAVIEGRLKKSEEAELIKATMEKISDAFKGIEIAEISSERKPEGIGSMITRGIAGMLLGDRQGMTVVGPATLVREIKQDPDKIQLFTSDRKRAGR